MRFSQDKIRDLASQVVAGLVSHPKVHLQEGEDALRVTIGSVILDDLREEDEIEREADALIAQHGSEIDRQDLDVEQLRRKFKQEIARRRGFVL
jgi:hypothetical protein